MVSLRGNHVQGPFCGLYTPPWDANRADDARAQLGSLVLGRNEDKKTLQP